MVGFNNFLKHVVGASLLVSINLFAANTVITQPFEQAEAHTDNFTLSSNPTGSVFQWASSGGVNDTGYLSIPNTSSDQIWTTKQTYSIEDNGVYILRAHYKTQGNSGYGSMGFTVASQANNSGSKGSPIATQYSLGMSFHGGGGSFFSNNVHTLVNSWGGKTGDLENSPPTWYLFELKIEDKTSGNFDLTFDIYDIDQTTGAKGDKWMDTKTLSITNANLKTEDELYVFFGADGYRMVGIDNFEIELSDNVAVTGNQTGSTQTGGSTNNAPTNVLLSSSTISENNAIGAIIGTLSAIDTDVGDTHTYSLACETPGGDDAYFSIVGTNLTANTIFDYESKNSHNICIRTTDSGGLFFDKNITISIINVNEAPEITSQPLTNVSQGDAYSYTLIASDSEGNTPVWSVKDGTTLPSWLTLNQALVSSFAGTGTLPTTDSGNHDSPDGTNATDAKINIFSSGNAIDAIDGKVFFSDVEEFGVRYIDENQKLQTFFAGNGDNSTLNISSIQHDPETNTTYMGDYSAHKIVKSVAGGALEDVATGINWFVFSLLLDKDNNKLYAGTRSAIYEIDLADSNNKRIIIGDGAFLGSYLDTGVASTSRVNQVSSMAFDGNGNLVFVDRMNHIVRKIDIANNTIETIAGKQGEATKVVSGDGGPAVDATFRDPTGLAIHPSGTIYITERLDKKIRIINTNGFIDEYATIPTSGFLSSFALSETNALYIGTNSQIFRLNINAELSGTPTTPGAYDVNLIASDGVNEVEHSFTITVTGDALSINPTISQGTSNGSTKIEHTPSDGNSIKYIYSNISVATPAYGTTVPQEAISYTSGNDIQNAESGKYLVVYEVDGDGKIVGFYQKELTSTDIHTTPINESQAGVCGSSNNQIFSSTPSENLCNVGNASSIAFANNTYYWNCYGTTVGGFTGDTAECSAMHQATDTPTEPEEPIVSTNEQCVEEAITSITFDSFKGTNDNQQFINENLSLTTSMQTECGQVVITWNSGDTDVISNDGVVISTNEPQTITMTATASYDDVESRKLFLLTVRSSTISDLEILENLVFDKIKGKNSKKSEIVSSLDLIPTLMNQNIIWSSSPNNLITSSGIITRGATDVNVTLTATVGDESKEFYLTIMAEPLNESDKLSKDKEWLNYGHILGKNKDNTNIEYNLATLPTIAPNGSTIAWESSNTDVLGNNGTITRFANRDNYVILQATFTLGDERVTREFILKVLQKTVQEEMGTSFKRVEQEDRKTTVVVQDENNATQTTTVEFDAGIVFERITDEESIKQSAEFSDKKLDIYLNTNGTTQSNMHLKDKNNNIFISTIKSNIPRTITTVDNTGKTTTSVATDSSDISATIHGDGSIEHIVKNKIDAKISKATSNVKGSSTIVNSNGSVETSSQIIQGDYIIKAVVTTDSQGQSLTKFVRENIKTLEQTNIENTMRPTTPYPSGNEVTIGTIGEKLYIKTVTPLENDLEVE